MIAQVPPSSLHAPHRIAVVKICNHAWCTPVALTSPTIACHVHNMGTLCQGRWVPCLARANAFGPVICALCACAARTPSLAFVPVIGGCAAPRASVESRAQGRFRAARDCSKSLGYGVRDDSGWPVCRSCQIARTLGVASLECSRTSTMATHVTRCARNCNVAIAIATLQLQLQLHLYLHLRVRLPLLPFDHKAR